MGNFNIRERAGLIVIVAVLLILGVGAWTFRRNGGQETQMVLTPPPPGSVEITAGGDDEKGNPAADTEAGAADAAITPAPEKPGGKKDEVSAAAAPLVVHVSGAVKRPNVYTLKSGDRIYQAIRAAGGFKKNADQNALNLADRVQDGDQINVPSLTATPSSRSAAAAPHPTVHASAVRRSPSAPPASASRVAPVKRGRVLGRTTSPTALRYAPSPNRESPDSESPAAALSSDKLKNPGEGTVNINTADAAELQRLPGVGPAMSERILQFRQEIGRFQASEQLMDVPGIGEKKFAKMQPFVRVE